MCLDCVDLQLNEQILGRYGWKVFIPDHGKLYCAMRGSSAYLRKHQWLNEKYHRENEEQHTLQTALCEESYPTGWHVYADKRPAIAAKNNSIANYNIANYVARRVEYKQVLVTGMQDGEHVIVARFIRIGGPRKKK